MLGRIAGITFALGLAAVVQAQSGPVGPGPGRDWAGPMGLGGVGFGQVVQNQPFSEVESTVSTQVFADGSKVVHETQTQVWRDAQGRIRTETAPLSNGQAVFTRAEIFDPVAQTLTTLDLNRKIVTVRQLPARPSNASPSANQGSAPGARERHLPAGVTVATTDLPGQSFAGVYATGKQTVRTVAAGTEGNTNAIVDTTQRYVAPDLKIVLYSSNTNPRGTTTRQATSLTQGDPDPSLFQVPAGFTVQTAPQHGRARWSGPGAQSAAPSGE